jgi:hypothetical protein
MDDFAKEFWSSAGTPLKGDMPAYYATDWFFELIKQFSEAARLAVVGAGVDEEKPQSIDAVLLTLKGHYTWPQQYQIARLLLLMFKAFGGETEPPIYARMNREMEAEMHRANRDLEEQTQ